jgi:DNA relaxase NicK
VRFDYYSAGVEASPQQVMDAVSKLGHELVPCHSLAKAYHFTDGFAVMHNQTGLACRVFIKDGQRPYAFASSDATDAFVDLVRTEWPDRHLVTRCDPCQDFYDGRARRQLTGLMRRMAKARRMRLRVIHDPLDPTAGQTTYLGSEKSEYRMRTYDKGWEQYGKLQAQLGRKGFNVPKDVRFKVPGGIEVSADQWVRAELQARPKDEEARRAAAVCTPEQAWGLTDWSHALAQQAFALELDRIYIRARKLSSDEEKLRWMLRMYKGPLRRMVGDLGSWDCVGLTLGEMLAEIEAEG